MEACETILYLNANPLIEDGSVIYDLLKNWMSRATVPILLPWGSKDQSNSTN
jgi:hypothetical protein